MKKYFPDQKPDEEIHLFLRRHWIAFVPTCLLVLVMLSIPILIVFGLRATGADLSRFRDLIILATSCYLLFVLAFFLASFIDYYLDIGIVTDRRAVNIDQEGLFARTISEQNLVRIQDVKTTKKGIFQTFFDFGDIFIQTAGEAPNFDFKSKPKPYEAAKTIAKLHEQALAKRRSEMKSPHNLPPTEDLEDLKEGNEVEL